MHSAQVTSIFSGGEGRTNQSPRGQLGDHLCKTSNPQLQGSSLLPPGETQALKVKAPPQQSLERKSEIINPS